MDGEFTEMKNATDFVRLFASCATRYDFWRPRSNQHPSPPAFPQQIQQRLCAMRFTKEYPCQNLHFHHIFVRWLNEILRVGYGNEISTRAILFASPKAPAFPINARTAQTCGEKILMWSGYNVIANGKF
jgi:hypothetical protein